MRRCLGSVGQVSFLLLATNRVDRGSREAKRAGGLGDIVVAGSQLFQTGRRAAAGLSALRLL